MTYREKILKLLGISKKFYCFSCETTYRVWGAKRNSVYWCQTCPSELVRDRINV